MQKVFSLLVISLFLILAGCSWLGVYREDIQQGNVISQQQVDQLKPGMTPEQVRFILGTPMIIDPLHKNRWDYVYSWQSGKHDEEFKLKRLTLFFKQGKLSHLVSDYKPQQPTELQQQADSPTDTKPSK